VCTRARARKYFDKKNDSLMQMLHKRKTRQKKKTETGLAKETLNPQAIQDFPPVHIRP